MVSKIAQTIIVILLIISLLYYTLMFLGLFSKEKQPRNKVTEFYYTTAKI